jgi:glycine reductase complex component B subunit alpha and beta
VLRLTLAIHPVTEVRFAQASELEGSSLLIDKEGLQRYLLEDDRLESVQVELVAAGESCRIGGVVDVIEPRAKEPADGSDFPGAIGPMRTAGSGTTHVLRGALVTLLGAGPAGAVIDMTGPWAEWSPFASHHHVVVFPQTRADLPRNVALNARNAAGLKAAAFLAAAAIGKASETTEVFESDGPAGENPEGLPRFVYIGQIHSRQRVAESGESILYGHNTNGLAPVVLHPNEWLDGALLAGNVGMNVHTYFYQNHPIITELYRWQQQGKIKLVGTIATIAGSDNFDRELNCMMAAQLAKWNLAADAAVLTKVGGGAPHADMGMTAHLCEELGIRTAVMVGPPNLSPERTVESATLFNYPDVDAIVFNSGGALFELPAASVERVVATSAEASDELFSLKALAASRVCGITSQQGAQRLKTFVY